MALEARPDRDGKAMPVTGSAWKSVEATGEAQVLKVSGGPDLRAASHPGKHCIPNVTCKVQSLHEAHVRQS